MKRDKNLQELSRDHHHGLLLGWKIRQGLKNDADTALMAEYVKYFSEQALIPHFEEEESQVLIYLPQEDSMKQRTLREHQEILSLIADLSGSQKIKPEILVEISDKLDKHIRFEERELFPYLEQNLDNRSLNEIGCAIEQTHQPFIDTFPDEFWKAN
jgi:hemerythrin-like domain-containing protein